MTYSHYKIDTTSNGYVLEWWCDSYFPSQDEQHTIEVFINVHDLISRLQELENVNPEEWVKNLRSTNRELLSQNAILSIEMSRLQNNEVPSIAPEPKTIIHG